MIAPFAGGRFLLTWRDNLFACIAFWSYIYLQLLCTYIHLFVLFDFVRSFVCRFCCLLHYIGFLLGFLSS